MTDRDVERQAWLILHEVLDLQENGLRKSSKFDTAKVKNVKTAGKLDERMQVKAMTTSARLGQLIRYLSTCACIAYYALKEDHPHDIVANPAGILLVKDVYKNVNDTRQKRLEKERERASSVGQANPSRRSRRQQQEGATQTPAGERRRSALDAALSDYGGSPLKRAMTLPPQRRFDANGSNLREHGNVNSLPTPSALPPNPYAVAPQSRRSSYRPPGQNQTQLEGGVGADSSARLKAGKGSSGDPIVLDVEEEQAGAMKVESEE